MKKNAQLYAQEILNSIVDFVLLSGIAAEDIRAAVDGRLALSGRPAVVDKNHALTPQGNDTISAVVLHRWHKDQKLLDETGAPRPLRLYGNSQSIEALVRAERPSVSAKEVVSSMRSLGLVKHASKGLYLPKSRVATINELHPLLIAHVSQSLRRLLKTVQGNVSSAGGKRTLIERFTHIPDLPVDQIQPFRQFSQTHGSTFLAGVDDWLEPRRLRRRKSAKDLGGVVAGIHVFAYVDDRPRKSKKVV